MPPDSLPHAAAPARGSGLVRPQERAPRSACTTRCAGSPGHAPAALPYPAAEDAHGAFVILVLAALILALDLEPRRQVPDADGALRLVDVLAARPPGPHALPLDVLLANLDLHFVRLRQHRDGRGRSVNAS